MTLVTDEEIREHARKIILEACSYAGFTDKDGKFLEKKIKTSDSNATVVLVESETGEIGFRCDYNAPYGKSTTIYSPQPFIEFKIRQMVRDVTSEDLDDVSSDLLGLQWAAKISDLAKVLVSIVADELWESVHVIPFLTINLAEFLGDRNFARQGLVEKSDKISEIVTEANLLRMERYAVLEKQQREAHSAPQYVFCDAYDVMLKEWKKAKTFYNRNKNSPNCLSLVKTAFPDLPEELIERLNIPKSYEASPAQLAFDNTAGMLNVIDAPSSESSRTRYLRESRKQRKQISDEEAANALQKYFSFARELDAMDERINEILKGQVSDS